MVKKKKKEIESSLLKMNDVLQRIETTNEEGEEATDFSLDSYQHQHGLQPSADNINYYSNMQGIHYIPPDQNNLPLFMK